MKHYPTIEHELRFGTPIVAFDKLDGSNVSSLWTYKKGLQRFSSRTRLIDEQSNELGKYSIPLMQAQETEIKSIIIDSFKRDIYTKEEFTLYFEFHGDKSFAGVHNYQDDKTLRVTLIDCNISRQGFISAKEFLDVFYYKGIPVSQPLYEGNLNQELVEAVKNGTLPNMTFEGVVCKARTKSRKTEELYRTKIKSIAWINKVKSVYTDPEELKRLL